MTTSSKKQIIYKDFLNLTLTILLFAFETQQKSNKSKCKKTFMHKKKRFSCTTVALRNSSLKQTTPFQSKKWSETVKVMS